MAVVSAETILPRNGEGDRPKGGGGGPRILQTPIKQVKRARRLRREMSLPEVLLWRVLRTKPDGLKFHRQFPIGRLTADFACLERRLVIEIDGEAHGLGDQPRRDAGRDAFLTEQGFRIMRIPAREVLSDLDVVVCGILERCGEAGPLHRPALPDGPPPRSGEDLS
jgi:very-short-patch-repair endonuclease